MPETGTPSYERAINAATAIQSAYRRRLPIAAKLLSVLAVDAVTPLDGEAALLLALKMWREERIRP